jgi:hypothetical protein
MKGTRHSEEQIIAILKQSEAGLTTAELCRQQFKGVEHVVSFAVIDTYDRCGGSDCVQINFLDPSKAQIQESIWINDSGEECERTNRIATASRLSPIVGEKSL